MSPKTKISPSTTRVGQRPCMLLTTLVCCRPSSRVVVRPRVLSSAKHMAAVAAILHCTTSAATAVPIHGSISACPPTLCPPFSLPARMPARGRCGWMHGRTPNHLSVQLPAQLPTRFPTHTHPCMVHSPLSPLANLPPPPPPPLPLLTQPSASSTFGLKYCNRTPQGCHTTNKYYG